MSEAAPVTALNGARYQGFAQVEETGLQGMITLRGDLGSGAVANALSGIGLSVPGQRERITGEGVSVAWMSPDELLILCGYEAAEETVARLTEALGGAHALVVNVSDARAMFRISGPGAREVIAKVMPVDMAAFAPGEIRRSRLAQVAAAIWMPDAETVEVVCFRSTAQYVFDVLCVSAAPGSAVGVIG